MLKLKSAFLIAAFAFFLLAVSSPAAAQSNNGTIYICVNLHNWQVRNVSNPNECKKHEVSIEWNSKLLRGDHGDRGPAGSVGPVGPMGVRGLAGLPGSAGPQGATGARGLAGPAGPQGTAGPQGAKGDKGEKGAIGPRGAIGPQGVIGLQGLTGPQGATGPQGLKGDKGDAGLQGPQGTAGPQGTPGQQGIQGSPGQSVTVISVPPGANCTNGGLMLTDSSGNHFICNGTPGAKGDTGAAGTPGASPVVTAEAAGANCANGGLKVTDASGAVNFVCNGASGTSGGGASEVYYTKTRVPGWNGVISPGSSATGFIEMATLTLPEGSYLVSAGAILRYLPGAGVTDRSSITCKLSDGTLNQEIRPRLSSLPPPGISDVLMSAILPMTFGPGGGTVRWECSANPNDTAHSLVALNGSVQVWAIRVSALHIQ